MIQCKYNAPNVSYATMLCANNAYNKYQKYMLQYSLNQKLDIVEQYNYNILLILYLYLINYYIINIYIFLIYFIIIILLLLFYFWFKRLHYKSARPAGY